jgi:hypothetical protein
VFFGPRLAFLVYWLIPAGQLRINLAFDTWIWPLLGLLLLPWTTLMYVIVFPVNEFDWVWVALAFIADLASYGGGAYNRRSVPGYYGR